MVSSHLLLKIWAGRSVTHTNNALNSAVPYSALPCLLDWLKRQVDKVEQHQHYRFAMALCFARGHLLMKRTEYLNYEGTKFSKSRNIGVFGENARDTGVPASVWRYFLLANRPEGSDSQFMWKDFIVRNNTELVNNLGNFVQRAIKFAAAKYDSVVPSPTKEAQDWATYDFFSAPEEQTLVKDINVLLQEYAAEMDQIKIRAGLEKVMAFSARCNAYLQTRELGNKLLEERPEDCATLIVVAVNLIYTLSAMVHPFMPATTEGILEQLQAPARSLPLKFTIDIWPGHKLGQPKHLFTRIDPKMEDVWRKQFGGEAAQETPP